ncbi:CsiV family protein [Marinobacterium arenosum]|uniref:CsiV family protein n=1 Tax=Marinobacterium arenosum TaxID=2862496 RepID=UPI001C954D4F|nr:CsiV family protein [Marinobacterium arenosum]MBY4677266.1 peptidoglycan binding protein CsiV [Marinobacterium arenosum]
MKKAALTLFTLCLFILSLPGRAQEAPWYQVEVLIFANEDPDVLDDEFWPETLSVPSLPDAVELAGPSGGLQHPYTLLPEDDLIFIAERRRIESYSSFRVLFHGSWRQPVTSERYAQPVHIRAGQVLDNGLYELDGYITVDKGRYLHFRPDLYHSRRLSPAESSVLRSFEQQGTDDSGHVNVDSGLHIPDFLTVNLRQGRRMRSKEVHYLDHPLMGVLVLMLPLEKTSQ